MVYAVFLFCSVTGDWEALMSYVLVHSTNSQEEALVIQSLLVSAGIPCKVAQESIGRIEAIFADGLGEQKIFVDEERADEARALLEQSSNSG